ncbi:Atg19p SCDLUD_002520 [Saccharomycodes ludwigii]|uniref:Atg19p n=1 Tax=Saccharomycodes ludwigii TaxID=36035 RepID=UPI001E890963|nr:hypothetical protein SCDLUD_002520 [Saccharomycodes ludwigii]KAH3901046.1 hypothetical protein SCDLUD_002520 [Saccharomycodes ludwigii]
MSSNNNNDISVSIPINEWKQSINSLSEAVEHLSIQQQQRKQDNINTKVDKKKQKGESDLTVHEYCYCDGECSTNTNNKQKFINGIRYKCLYCYNFDLCELCENKGFETGSHKKWHNMVKIKTPSTESSITGSFGNMFVPCSPTNTTTTNSDTDSNNYTCPYKEITATNDNDNMVPVSDVIIDISDKHNQLFEFFSAIKDEQELLDIMNKYKSYDKLVEELDVLKNERQKKSISSDTAASSSNIMDKEQKSCEAEKDCQDVSSSTNTITNTSTFYSYSSPSSLSLGTDDYEILSESDLD